MPRQVVDNAAKRLALNVRTTETLRRRLENAAMMSGKVLSQEIDSRLTKSFDVDEQITRELETKKELRSIISALEDKIAAVKKQEILLWPEASARVLGEAFALTVTAAQQQFGQSWRESGSVVAVVVAVMRDVMTKLGCPGAEFDTLTNRARIDEATSNIARSMIETFKGTMPPLPKLERPSERSPMTGRARIVSTFRDNATGNVLETTTGPEFDINDPKDRLQSGPEYRAAIERYRPRRDSIHIETSIMHVLQDGGSAWDALPENHSAGRLVGAAEAAAEFEPARGLLPDSIGGTALLHETMGPDRDGDATADPVKPAPAPGPARRKVKVKVKA